MSNAKAGKTQANDGDLVPRNEFGGVYVDEEELRAAFDFFDVHKKGTLVGRQLCPLRHCSSRRGLIAHASEPATRLPCCPRRGSCTRANPCRNSLVLQHLTLACPDTRRPETTPRRVLQEPASSRVQVPHQRTRFQFQYPEKAARQ